MVNNNSGGSASVKHDANAGGVGSGGAADEKTMPKDARVMVSILKDMGIMDFEPRVVNQLLEFSYRYISTILDDSKVRTSQRKRRDSFRGSDISYVYCCWQCYEFNTQ